MAAENFSRSVGSLGGTIDRLRGDSVVVIGCSDTSARSIQVVESVSTMLVTARRATATSIAVRFALLPPVAEFAAAPRRRPTRHCASGRSMASAISVSSCSIFRMVMNDGRGSSSAITTEYGSWSVPSTASWSSVRSSAESRLDADWQKVSCECSSRRTCSRLNFEGRRKSISRTRCWRMLI